MISIKAIQDSLNANDTLKVVKAYKLEPAISKDIKSEEGAIIPKEAVSMIKLVPSTSIEAEKPTPVLTYVLIAFSFVVFALFIRALLKKRKS